MTPGTAVDDEPIGELVAPELDPELAARRLAAARSDLFTAVRRRLLDKLGVGPATLESIIRLVGSELELSLDRYL